MISYAKLFAMRLFHAVIDVKLVVGTVLETEEATRLASPIARAFWNATTSASAIILAAKVHVPLVRSSAILSVLIDDVLCNAANLVSLALNLARTAVLM